MELESQNERYKQTVLVGLQKMGRSVWAEVTDGRCHAVIALREP